MIQINGFRNRYFITEDGNIFSNYLGGFMSQKKHRHGYMSIMLKDGEIKKRVSVHRLVAIAFVPNPDNKPEVNHKDGNKLNNHKDNLEWSTRSENNKHALEYNLRVAPNKLNFSKKYYNSNPVYYIKDVAIIEFLSRKDCARSFGVNKSAVQNAIKRGTNFRGGILL